MTRSDHTYADQSKTFICEKCHTTVAPPEGGSLHRNHCPACLWSKHVDVKTGDRRCVCRGLMEPIGVWAKSRGEWSLIHRCVKCGSIRVNRIAADDSHMELLKLALKPVMLAPFPHELFLESDGREARAGGGK